jgi:hypothetical protein
MGDDLSLVLLPFFAVRAGTLDIVLLFLLHLPLPRAQA